MSTTIPEHVLPILRASTIVGLALKLPTGQLDRKVYQDVNRVLEAAGGEWDRKSKAHLFDEAGIGKIEQAIESGVYHEPEDLAYYPTPDSLVDQMIEMVGGIQPTDRVLEPSAGEGAIAKKLVGAGYVRCIEIDSDRSLKLCGLLVGDGTDIEISVKDFLAVPALEGAFDKVVMNPPFSLPGRPRADLDHVEHAISFLKSGGKLVAVMGAGITFRQDKRTRDFLSKYPGKLTLLPAGTFKISGTNVNTCLFYYEKP